MAAGCIMGRCSAGKPAVHVDVTLCLRNTTTSSRFSRSPMNICGTNKSNPWRPTSKLPGLQGSAWCHMVHAPCTKTKPISQWLGVTSNLRPHPSSLSPLSFLHLYYQIKLKAETILELIVFFWGHWTMCLSLQSSSFQGNRYPGQDFRLCSLITNLTHKNSLLHDQLYHEGITNASERSI